MKLFHCLSSKGILNGVTGQASSVGNDHQNPWEGQERAGLTQFRHFLWRYVWAQRLDDIPTRSSQANALDFFLQDFSLQGMSATVVSLLREETVDLGRQVSGWMEMGFVLAWDLSEYLDLKMQLLGGSRRQVEMGPAPRPLIY